MDLTIPLAVIAGPHQGGHHCPSATDPTQSRWYNPNTPHGLPCPVLVAVDTIRTRAEEQRQAVHNAAHTDAGPIAVVEGMTGLTLDDLDPDDRYAWILSGRLAIEALAAHLDPTIGQDDDPADLPSIITDGLAWD